MAKSIYTLTLKLKINQGQENVLEKRFEIGRKIYNLVLAKSLKRYKEMIKTRAYRENQKNLSEIYDKYKTDCKKLKKESKQFYKIKNDLLKQYGLSEYSLHSDVKKYQKYYKKNIDSFTAQKIASRVWISYDKLLFGNGDKIHFKSYNNGLMSLEGKSNKTGIVYKLENNLVKWLGLEIPVKLNVNNDYETKALMDKICYCRIKRKFVRGRYKYYLQLILEGLPPIKTNKQTGEIKNDIGYGNCGVDIGTRTIAYVNDYESKLLELAPNVENIEKEKRKLLRYMDRSKRTTNPDNFNDNGTIKRGIKLIWNFSNRYNKAKNKLKDLYRKQADIRELDHNIMSNEIIKSCDTVLVEDMNYKGLQARAKNTEKNEQGKFKKKKRFGKSLANKAPAMFITVLERKLNSKGGKLSKINTWEVKASQYNHLNQECNKKKLSQRWNYFNYKGNEIKIQRDLYSAFLIMNVKDDLKTIDNELCNKKFDKFLDNHNKEIERLQGLNNLSSMGI